MFPAATRFLIVDDFSTMRKILKKSLNDLGYTNIAEADDGKTAVPILQRGLETNNPIQFVISDLKMPGLNGIDLLRVCKNNPELKSIPFMLAAAGSEQKDLAVTIKEGVSDFVVKPFDVAILKGKLERIWSKQIHS